MTFDELKNPCGAFRIFESLLHRCWRHAHSPSLLRTGHAQARVFATNSESECLQRTGLQSNTSSIYRLFWTTMKKKQQTKSEEHEKVWW